MAATRTGTIEAVAAGRARVRLDPPATCAGCAGRCAAQLFAGAAQALDLPAPPGLVPGQRVRCELAGARLVVMAVLAFGVPLTALLAGAGLAGVLAPGGGDAAAAAGALAGLALAPRVARRLGGAGPWGLRLAADD